MTGNHTSEETKAKNQPSKEQKPGDPAGTVENPKHRFPTVPWTAPAALTTGPPGPTTTSLQQEKGLGWK
jgi:hypothetical protein